MTQLDTDTLLIRPGHDQHSKLAPQDNTLQEKLRLDMDDEGASEWVQHLINESATAVMPQLMEAAHSFAQYWR